MQPRRAALALVLLLAIVPFAPALVKREIFHFRDHADYFQPLRFFTAQQLRAGVLPLWNPYNASGEPWLANPQTGVFYPPAWLFILLPFATAYVAYIALHMLLLGAGAYLLFARRHSWRAALIGAVATMFAGSTLSLLDVTNNFTSFAWIPLVLVCALDRGEQRPRHSRAISAVVLAALFLAGEPFFAATGVLMFASLVLSRKRRRGLGDIAVCGVLAFLLSAVQLLPFAELVRDSDRGAGLMRAQMFAESMPPANWLRVAVPPAVDDRLFDTALGQHFVPLVYAGAVIVLLAAFALLISIRERRVEAASYGWLALLIAAILIGGGDHVPLVRDLIAHLPVTPFRYPARLVPFGVFALIALAVTGYDRIDRLSLPMRALTAAGLLALVAISGVIITPASMAALVMTMLVAVTGARLTTRTLGAVAIVVFLTFDLLPRAAPLLASESFVRHPVRYSPQVGSDGKLVRIQDARVRRAGGFDRAAWIGGYLNLFDARFDASTAAPVVSAAYLRVHDQALASADLALLSRMAVRYFLVAHPLAPFTTIARDGGVLVVRNDRALPMATLWSSVATARSDEAALQRALAVGSDRPVIVPAAAANAAVLQVAAAASVALNSDRAIVRIAAPFAGVLVLTQQDGPGWRVFVDGRERPSLRADGVFRAVEIGPGEHEVVWRYLPSSLTAGAAMTLAGIVLCVISAAAEKKSRC